MYRIACLLLCALSLPSHALTKVDVFKTEVVLPKQDKAEAAAQAQGLEQVLIKASGQKSVASNEVISKALRSSGQYLSQIGTGSIAGEPSLVMAFNPRQVQSLLTQAAVPYWTPNRSNVLVWVVEEDRYQRQIAWEQSGSRAVTQITEHAQTRGLPITVPVGDFDDVTGISAPDLWGGFVTPISNASTRYPADAVLVVRIQHLSNRTSVRWTLYDQKPEAMVSEQTSPMTGQLSGAVGPVLEQVVDQVSDYFSSKSAVQVSDSSTQYVLTEFLDVSNASDFFNLESLLKGLNSVATVDVMKIHATGITFRVHLLAAQADFERELSNFKQVQKFEMTPEFELIESQPVDEANTVNAEAVLVDSNEPDAAVAPATNNEPSVSGFDSNTGVNSAEDVAAEETLAEDTDVVEDIYKATLVYEWLG